MNNYSYAVSLESIGLEKNNFKSDFETGKSFKTTLLGIDISTFSEQTQFVLISFGVFVSFILYGYLLVCFHSFDLYNMSSDVSTFIPGIYFYSTSIKIPWPLSNFLTVFVVCSVCISRIIFQERHEKEVNV